MAVIPYCRGVSEAVRSVLASHKIRTVMRPRKLKWPLMRDVQSLLISTYNFGQRKNSLLSRITC